MNTPVQINVPEVKTWLDDTTPTTIGKGWLQARFIHAGVVIERQEGGEYFQGLPKEEAVDLAKKTLLAYNIPFCNRVKGAGIEGEQ